MSDRGRVTVGTVLRALRTPVTLIVLLCILGYAAWWGYEKVTAPIPPPPVTPCVQQPIEKGVLRTDQVTVRVLNGGTKRGLAGDIAADLRKEGFEVSDVGNTEEEITATVLVVQDKDNPEAKLIKAFFPKATVREEPNRVDHMIDVLVGDPKTGFDSKAKQSIKVSEPTVCLPMLPGQEAS